MTQRMESGFQSLTAGQGEVRGATYLILIYGFFRRLLQRYLSVTTVVNKEIKLFVLGGL